MFKREDYKMKKLLSAIFSLALIVGLLSSCAAKADGEDYAYDGGNYESSVSEDRYDMTPGTSEENAGFSSSSTLTSFAPENQKMVYTSSLNIETKDFDESYDTIFSALKAANGYVSTKEVNGGYTTTNNYYQTKSAYLCLKIPADKYDEFLAQGASFGNVTRQSDSSDNITASYIDTEARLASLKAQQEQLLKLMNQATTMEDIIVIQQSLTDVVYQIESYTSTLRNYDNMVSYCTVTIDLYEVSTISVNPTTFGQHLVETLKDSGRVVVGFFEGLVIVVIYLLPFAIIGLALFFIIRAIVRKRRANKLKAFEASQTPVASEPFAVENGRPQNKKK